MIAKTKIKKIISKNTPSDLDLFFTRKCNLHCHYCFLHKEGTDNVTLGTLDEGSLKKSIDILFSYPGKKKAISFMGGEPTLEFPLIKKIYNYAKNEANKKNITLIASLVTNGTFLNQEMVDFFIKNKISFRISIDGDRLTHDQNRPFKSNPKKSSFDQIIRNIDRINFGDLPLAASMVLIPNGTKRLLENLDFLNNKGFVWIDFVPDLYANWQERDLEKIRNAMKNFESYYIKLVKGGGKTFKTSLLRRFVNDESGNKLSVCGKIHIDVDKNFYLCDRAFALEKKPREKYIVGNIQEGIDNNKRLQLLDKIGNDFFKESGLDCLKCKYYKYCCCPIGLYIYYLNLEKLNKIKQGQSFLKSFCEILKIYIEANLRIKKALRYNLNFIELYEN
ncbi:MAG: radical SAM protein [Candidatus Omnitrophica bacterium]|nr:radical SAM protein [Candidatus Omnitrophota bacterium]